MYTSCKPIALGSINSAQFINFFKNGACSWYLTTVVYIRVYISVYMKIKSLLQSKMHMPFLKVILRLLV